jgi:hypothetical protein
MEDSADKAQKYVDEGYHVTSIYDHVDTFTKTLISRREFNKEELNKMRDSGYKLSKSFWVNIALTSCRDSDKVVITDLNAMDEKKMFAKVL